MKKTILSIFIMLLTSCNNEFVETDTYTIINIIYKNVVSTTKNLEKYIPLPCDKTNNSTFKKKLNPYYKTIDKIAIVPYFKHFNRELSTMKCKGYEELSNIKGIEKKLEIFKIKLKGDTIIPFHKKMIIKGRKDFVDMGFDLLLQFSDVVFNKTKAVVIFNSSTNTLAGSTVLYTLEKQNNKWVITCEQTLSLS